MAGLNRRRPFKGLLRERELHNHCRWDGATRKAIVCWLHDVVQSGNITLRCGTSMQQKSCPGAVSFTKYNIRCVKNSNIAQNCALDVVLWREFKNMEENRRIWDSIRQKQVCRTQNLYNFVISIDPNSFVAYFKCWIEISFYSQRDSGWPLSVT